MKRSYKFSLKLSKRLQQIDQMVTSQQYAHIWDCCCDHGLLGFTLLSRNAASRIHFVDIVPELMTELESKLQHFYSTPSSSTSSSWQTHCLDVAKLPLKEYEGRQLIIIAGVGGDLMIKFIEAIYQQYPNFEVDFLLCPVHHQFSLREKLIALDFSLRDEVLVEDNKRFYEILLVSTTSDDSKKVSPVGNKIWSSPSNPHLNQKTEIVNKYLAKTLKHYRRIQQGVQQGKQSSVQHIIDAYSAIKL